MKARVLNKEKSKIAYVLMLFILLSSLFAISGCSTKRAITFIPAEESGISCTTGDCQKETKDIDLEMSQAKKASLMEHFSIWKGTRYRAGGLSRQGIDCSGFALLTYKKLFGKSLPRTVREQVKTGQNIPRTSLQPGDLVFFKTGVVQKHVGIYLENDWFMHASPSQGVMISRLNDSYWENHFWQAKRIEPLVIQNGLYSFVPDTL